MTLINNRYDPAEIEQKWYQYWDKHGFFSAAPDSQKTPYTIVIPPPNVTGVLHMGHILNNTIQDVLIRRARMQGKSACWVPGTDHASIATEAKVVAKLEADGIKKTDVTREQFLSHAWDWKEKYGGIILNQLKRMGASCDWNRTRFTMDPSLSHAVVDVFNKLYEDGLIYKGYRMVNWDPQGKTALSDEEVIYKEGPSKLYYIKYFIEGSNEFITIATTRPETIFGDTAVCVHPEDTRYQHLHHQKVLLPLLQKAIPIIVDSYVDPSFGTGALKVTPAHDINDYNLGLKHQLEVIDIFTDTGKLNDHAKMYVGEDRFVARKKVAKELDTLGLLVNVEEITNNVGYSERTNAAIEPRLSSQWFVDMKKFMSENPQVLQAVMDDEITLHPAKFKNTYKHWIENIKDWCISRQLWWGHRIPAYYLPDGRFVVARTEAEALEKAKKLQTDIKLQQLQQDEDVLDTWFSSWLWPISVFDGFKDPANKDIQYFYPTDTLVTAPEILFFWVARMVMAGYKFRNKKPFSNVYLTGIVRDKAGRKMSKSLGNSPDPLLLMDQYSADGVRMGMLLSSPAGNDLLFDEKQCEQGRNFCNKIWNAFRLIKGWAVHDFTEEPVDQVAVEWFEARFNKVLQETENLYEKFRLSEALKAIYGLVWDDFCSWYLEMIKPAYEQPIDRSTYHKTVIFFERILKVIHPFMPFISEELWHQIGDRRESDCLIVARWPEAGTVDEAILKGGDTALEVITNVRNLRSAHQIARQLPLKLVIKTENITTYQRFIPIIKKMAALETITFADSIQQGGIGFIIKNDEFHIPLQVQIDKKKEKELIGKEIDYIQGFLASVEKKLSNEKFVTSAPAAVVALEKQKKDDALSKLNLLQESLNKL